MQTPTDALLLRIFIGESDRCHHKPLYEAIVLAAREAQLAGATVLRGPLGFGLVKAAEEEDRFRFGFAGTKRSRRPRPSLSACGRFADGSPSRIYLGVACSTGVTKTFLAKCRFRRCNRS